MSSQCIYKVNGLLKLNLVRYPIDEDALDVMDRLEHLDSQPPARECRQRVGHDRLD